MDKLIISIIPYQSFHFFRYKIDAFLYCTRETAYYLKVLFDLWSYNKVGNGIISLSCACDEHCQLLSFIWMRYQLVCNKIFFTGFQFAVYCISSKFHRLGCYIICFKHICDESFEYSLLCHDRYRYTAFFKWHMHQIFQISFYIFFFKVVVNKM